MRNGLIALSLLAAGTCVPASSTGAALSAHLSADSGSIGIRIVDVPAKWRNDPLARLYIVNRLAPGTSIRRRVEVSNSTRSTAAVAAYPAAASLRKSRFVFGAGHHRNELSNWTSVSRDELRLAPGGKGFETVTIRVHNSGKRTIAISGNLTLSNGPGGVRAGPFPVKLVVPLAPGSTRA